MSVRCLCNMHPMLEVIFCRSVVYASQAGCDLVKLVSRLSVVLDACGWRLVACTSCSTDSCGSRPYRSV